MTFRAETLRWAPPGGVHTGQVDYRLARNAGGVVGGGVAFGAVALAALAVVARWGTGWLAALAGGQAVLGPAGLFGTAAAVGSAWYAGAAIVLASPGGWLAVPFGASAGLVVA